MRLNFARVSPNEPDKPGGEDRQQRQRSNGCEQPYPGDAIKDWPLQERVAGVRRDLIEPLTVSGAGPVNLRALQEL